MTDTARHLHDAKPSLFSTQSRTQRQIDALKSKAAGALRSPYVKGGLILGVAAAGYALVRHNKAAAHRKVDKVVSYVPLAARTAPPPPRAVERPPSVVDILKVGSLLLSVVGSLVSATGNARVESAPASAGKPVQLRSADESTDGGAAPPAAGAPAEPVFEKPAASWLGRQWQIIKGAAVAWIDDFAPSMGAALSYYTLFSLAPLLVIVIAIAGLVFGHDAAQGAIVAQLGGIMGKEGATAVQGLLKAAQEPSTGIVASIVGFVLLLVGATAIFAELQSDLDRIWRAPAKKNESGLWSWLRSRVLSFGLILGLAFMLMVSLVVSAALSASSAWLGGSAAESLIFTVLNFLASLGIFTVLFAMIYKIMPNVKISWHDVWTGAFVTALLFNIGKSLIGLYLAKSNVASGFGAAGSFVILVAWFYYSAQIFLFGAEYTWVHANSRKRQHA